MLKKRQHIILWVMLLCSAITANAQLPMPDTVCVGVTKRYKVNDATIPSTYVWKVNGIIQAATTHEIFVTWNSPGVFTITVEETNANGCKGDIQQGVVVVFPIPIANAGPNQTICFNNTTTLNASGGNSYVWSPSQYLSSATSANPTVTLPTAGVYNYYVKVTNAAGCSALKEDTVTITMLQPLRVFAGNDTSIAIGQTLQLNAIDINGGITNYSWQPFTGLNNSAIPNPILTLNSFGVYTYTVTGQNSIGCTTTDALKVTIFKGPEIYVPTIFTPNGDGNNDVFIPKYVGIKELQYFTVFNRFGQVLFTTNNQYQGWDGKFKVSLQNNEVFVWQVEGISFIGEKIYKKGTVVLAK
jgi:gliding motility-associated-like protein